MAIAPDRGRAIYVATRNAQQNCILRTTQNPIRSSHHKAIGYANPVTRGCTSDSSSQKRVGFLFLIHIRVGGYGVEFSKLYSASQRKVWQSELAAGKDVALHRIRERKLVGDPWWEKLTLDPESLVAAWARPRPLRPRPDLEAYRAAMAQVKPSEKELALLRCHANSPNHSANMRHLAKQALNSDNPSTANLAYGSLAHRLCSALPEWKPDTRIDGSPIWMSIVAEGWEPEGREFEWVLVPQLRELFGYTLSNEP